MLTICVHWSVLLILLQNGWTPLHVASQEGHDQIVELLLQAGASVDQETEVKCGVGQDGVCETEQCTYTLRFLHFVSSTLSQFVFGVGRHYTQQLLNSNICWSWTTEYLWWLLKTKRKPLLFCKQQNLGTQSSVNMVCVSTFRNCLLSQTLLKDFSNGCKT